MPPDRAAWCRPLEISDEERRRLETEKRRYGPPSHHSRPKTHNEKSEASRVGALRRWAKPDIEKEAARMEKIRRKQK